MRSLHLRPSRNRQRTQSEGGDPRILRNGGLAAVGTDGVVIHAAPAQVTSSMRYLIARLQLNDATGVPARLGLTSAIQAEGVTFVARSLAAVTAYDLKRRVCVVDLNWWSTTEDSALGDRPGVADVARGVAHLDDILVPTVDPSLWMAPAGELDVADRPVLAKDPVLDGVLDDLAHRFDHLIVELPPVLVASDALTMARLCDAVALVVRQGVTSESQVRDAIEELRSVVLLGTVLNRYVSKVPRRIVSMLSV